MKKDTDDICPPITSEEFCNIMDLWISPDQECKILAEELLRPYVYDIIENRIFLTKAFSIKHRFGGWFQWSCGGMAGPKITYKQWMEELKNCQK